MNGYIKKVFKGFLGTAVLLCVVLFSASVMAYTQIDTTSAADGSMGVFGYVPSATPTFGQVITVPVTDTVLANFSFMMNLPDTVVFRGEVYAWDGNKATGPNLYESEPMTTSGTGGYELITFAIAGGVQLTAGSQYVIFATTSKDTGSGSGNLRYKNSDIYTGGKETATFSSPSGWTTTDWYGLSPGDLAFKATFQSPAQVIYNNFGENDSCDRDPYYSVSNVTGFICTFATSFTPSVSGYVSEIWAGIGSYTGDNAMAVALMTDDSNKPGSVLEEWDFRGQMVSIMSEPFTPLHGVGAGTTEISAGTKYWIAATIPANATGDHGWLTPIDVNVRGLLADKNSNGFTGVGWTNRGYNDQPAFRISAYIIDKCPEDPAKTEPGICGCGVEETGDSDGDGTLDCIDGCPSDPAKTEPGICGCGVADTDTDGDGTPDCNDGCPYDPEKQAPGICGCGTSDTTDSDGDGIIDCNDNCPYDYNPDQTDVNGNGTGDVCDTLPDLTASWASLKFNTKNNTCSGRLKINNVGASNASAFSVSYYLSNNGTALGDLIATDTISGVRVGRSVGSALRYQSATSLIGKYVIAVVDSDDDVIEQKEDNNKASQLIQ